MNISDNNVVSRYDINLGNIEMIYSITFEG